MSVPTAAPTSAAGAEPVPDVLEAGGEEAPWRLTPRQVRVAGALAAAAVAGGVVLVPPWLAGPAPADAGAQPLPLVLREGSVALPRRAAPPEQGRVRGGVHVEIVNESRRALHLTSAALVPGSWEVDVVRDVDNSVRPSREGRLLRPGWTAVLVLHRVVDCTPGAELGAVPTSLVVEADVDGRRAVRSIDVSPDSTAYEGGLDDLLGAPTAFCAPHGDARSSFTTGDPGQVFLELASTG